MAEPGRRSSLTATELHEQYRGISVERAKGGMIAVQRTIGAAVLSLDMQLVYASSKLVRELRIRGGAGPVPERLTTILVPIMAGGLAHKSVVESGDDTTDPDDLIDTAQQAITLLAGYLRLSPDERNQFHAVPDGAQVHDYTVMGNSSSQPVQSSGVRVPKQWTYDVFSAAQRIFLEPLPEVSESPSSL